MPALVGMGLAHVQMQFLITLNQERKLFAGAARHLCLQPSLCLYSSAADGSARRLLRFTRERSRLLLFLLRRVGGKTLNGRHRLLDHYPDVQHARG